MIGTLLTGLGAGAQYALLAMGVVIVFETTAIVNFSIGALATLAVYAAITVDIGHVPPIIVVFIAIAAASVAAILSDQLIATPIARRYPTQAKELVLVVLLVLFVTLQSLIGYIWGTTPRALPVNLELQGAYHIAGAIVTESTLTTYIVTIVLIVATLYILRKTSVGLKIRAIAERETSVGLLGISATRYKLLTWAYAGFLAATSGLLLATTVTPSPTMTENVMIKAVAGVALGGITSLGGAIVGSLLVGVAESITTVYINPELVNIIPIAIILLVLVIRPRGLFGRLDVVRV